MSTRGAFGFRSEGVDKVTYNSHDSYPTGLGKDIMVELNKAKMCVKAMRKMFSKVKMVKDREDDKNYSKCKFFPYLTNSFSMYEAGKFLHDSLFCEWAYILNLDDEVLEIYQGYNKEADSLGRYAEFKQDDYYGVKLIAVIPLDDLYSTTIDKIDVVCEMLEKMEIKTSTIQSIQTIQTIQSMTALSEKIEKILVV